MKRTKNKTPEIYPEIKCPECGHKYRRKEGQCPYCRREERWKQLPIEKKLPEFPMKIIRPIESYSFMKKISRIKTGTFIHGEADSGKTTAAAHIILCRQRENYLNRKWETVQFVTLSDFFQEIRNTFNKKSETSEQDILDKYRDCDWLVLDDIGTDKPSDWSFSMLYILINYRYNNEKKTIITSNYSIEELEEVLQDTRIPRRILEMSEKVIKLK